MPIMYLGHKMKKVKLPIDLISLVFYFIDRTKKPQHIKSMVGSHPIMVGSHTLIVKIRIAIIFLLKGGDMKP